MEKGAIGADHGKGKLLLAFRYAEIGGIRDVALSDEHYILEDALEVPVLQPDPVGLVSLEIESILCDEFCVLSVPRLLM